MALQEVSERDFVDEVMKSKVPVLVEFGADWCGPCKVVAPELKALANELEGKAKVVSVDIDRSPVLARELGVQAVPTFVVFDKGRPVGAHSGAMKKAQLRELIEPFLPRQAGALKPEEVAPLLMRRQVVLVDTREQSVFERKGAPSTGHSYANCGHRESTGGIAHVAGRTCSLLPLGRANQGPRQQTCRAGSASEFP